MKKARHFEFAYPITNMCLGGPQHVGDVLVTAIVYRLENGTLHRDPDDKKVTVDIDLITWDGCNIKPLLECLAEETYEQITEAARQHGSDRFELIVPLQQSAY